MDLTLLITAAAVALFFVPAPGPFDRWDSLGDIALMIGVWIGLFAAFTAVTAFVLACAKAWWTS